MDSVDKLREWARQHKGWNLFDLQINEMADEIEHEIASNYCELPKDADGTPIRVGDKLVVKFPTKPKPFTVSFVGDNSVAFWVDGEQHLKSFNLEQVLVTHYHEPTVEDVLREFAGTLASAKNNWGSDVDDAIAEYAVKLR